jgi:hypothetical protein|tara:strand:+ start:659 stop:976 length:318 start_codon:yes stop_codon:yes gene_type:complete
MKYKMIPCSECKEDMPELRLTQYNYSFCVKCSEAGLGSETKKAITVLKGEGDHTWVETIVMSDSDYNSYLSEKEENVKRSNENKEDIEDDKNIQGPFKIINTKEK